MKKFAVLLALMMSLCSLASCGDSKKSSKSGKNSSSVTESDENKNTDSDDDDEGESAEGFERGSVSGKTYTSEFGGIKFTAPSEWVYSTDEQILSMMNIALDVTGNDNELTKQLLEQAVIYDAQAMNVTTGENVIIMYENLRKEGINPDTITAESYLDIVKSQLENMSGVTYSDFSDYEKVRFGNKEFLRFKLTSTYGTLNYSCSQIQYVRKTGDFIMAIIVSSGAEKRDMTVYEDCFEAID
ncbi:MAG: hypothetical protein J6L05_00205 [Ruminococcus sp.]|nr:hypothetical protein [Ruminococcus sp.]